MGRLRSARGSAEALRARAVRWCWGWLRFFPGDSALLACAAVGALVAAGVASLQVVLMGLLGEPGGLAAQFVPYAAGVAAFLVFPGSDPVALRAVGAALAFLVGSAPLTWAYIALAGAAERDGATCRALWAAASWIPRRVHQLLLAVAGRRPVYMRRGGPVPAWMIAALVALTGMGLAFRLQAARRTLGPGSPDAVEYDSLARRLARGEPYLLSHSVAFPATPPVTTYANRTPGYPAFLALVYHVAGKAPSSQRRAAVYVQCVVDVLTALLVLGALRRVAPNWAALLSAGLWLSYVPAASSALLFLPESLAAFLLAGVVYMTLGERHPGRWAVGGALAGWAALARPELMALLVVMPACALALPACPARGRGWRGKGWRGGLFAAAFLLVLAPWVVRNARVLGRPVVTSTAGGFNVWAGNYLPFGGVTRQETSALEREILQRQGVDPTDEVALDRALLREGLGNVVRYLRTRPWEYMQLLGRKCQDMWIIPMQFKLGPGRGVEARGVFFFLLLVGAGAACRNWRVMLPLLAFPICQTAMHCLTYAHDDLHIRFLLPVMPMVIGLAAVGAWFLAQRPEEACAPDAGGCQAERPARE